MSMSSIEDYLSSHAFFSGLSDDFIEFLADCATKMRIKDGEALFKQGERADKFYLLRSGQVSIQVPALMGPTLEIQTLGEDQILGWSWLISPYRWSFQARAIEDSEVIEFDGSAILARCEQDPAFGYELFKRFAALMSERLDAARQKMMDQWDPPGFA
ncbi:MAG: cyclic nucleotide-binding domain-containing protein [Gammaproteobacteria bacterium]|nr:cyclic nucleotide-binding domain-containing protein [Gammaproteobacteria bacterium]